MSVNNEEIIKLQANIIAIAANNMCERIGSCDLSIEVAIDKAICASGKKVSSLKLVRVFVDSCVYAESFQPSEHKIKH